MLQALSASFCSWHFATINSPEPLQQSSNAFTSGMHFSVLARSRIIFGISTSSSTFRSRRSSGSPAVETNAYVSSVRGGQTQPSTRVEEALTESMGSSFVCAERNRWFRRVVCKRMSHLSQISVATRKETASTGPREVFVVLILLRNDSSRLRQKMKELP